MNKICILVQEMLPLYKDNACNEKCSKIIKEHLETCEECKTQLSKVDIDINVKREYLEEAVDIKKVSKRFRNEMIKNILKGLLIAAIILLILYCFIDIRVF